MTCASAHPKTSGTLAELCDGHVSCSHHFPPPPPPPLYFLHTCLRPRVHRYIFGSGGDTPNILAAVGRLVTCAARGSAPIPEPGLLGRLRRDRERRASVAIDRLSFVASPNGFLTAARAATALEAAAAAASRAASPTVRKENGMEADAGQRHAPAVATVRRSSPPLPLRPSVSTSVQVQLGELRSLLSLESRPLASLSLSGLAFETSRSDWWELDNVGDGVFQASSRGQTAPPGGVGGSACPYPTRTATEVARERSMPSAGWPGWTWTGGRHRTALGYVRVSLHALDVLDLTTDGQLHTEVISLAETAEAAAPVAAPAAGTSTTYRRSSSGKSSRAHQHAAKSTAATRPPPPAVRSPVIVVERIPTRSRGGGDEGGEVKASVRGLRVCFLRRFMAEVIKYFGPDGLGPVFAVARSFGADGVGSPGTVGIGSDTDDQDEEKVAVVVGEEDVAIPDNWSVISPGSRASYSSSPPPAAAAAASPGDWRARSNGAVPVAGSRFDGGGASVSGETGGGSAGVRVTAVLENVTVIVPRSTHSREAAAVKCDELVVEVSSKQLYGHCKACTVLSCPPTTEGDRLGG